MSGLIARAASLFRRFHGREPVTGDIVELDCAAATALYIGQVVAVIYKTNEDAKPFFHRFNVARRPLLFVSADGKQVYIVKGGYRLTERGFIG